MLRLLSLLTLFAVLAFGDVFKLFQIGVAHLAGGVGPYRLIHVHYRHIPSLEPTRGDGAAIQREAGHIEANERHRRRRDRLVASHQRDDGIEHVAAPH